ncbi:hypothetical protein DFH08DRAFT_854815 [Mycena albidolilacea]|uniref:Uncharacterized protein n=1 Tax=Mycena albidolilacea TaxID=1033008 RepID=A0AAD7ACZ2_9AGAR|nr:hypothetical protein DFH08DRAFT_854815 [Mycena albidolilacea]
MSPFKTSSVFLSWALDLGLKLVCFGGSFSLNILRAMVSPADPSHRPCSHKRRVLFLCATHSHLVACSVLASPLRWHTCCDSYGLHICVQVLSPLSFLLTLWRSSVRWVLINARALKLNAQPLPRPPRPLLVRHGRSAALEWRDARHAPRRLPPRHSPTLGVPRTSCRTHALNP